MVTVGKIAKGESFSHTFGEAGTFRYHCVPHSGQADGHYQGMVATVIVENV